MNTAREFPAHAISPVLARRTSLWVRVTKSLKGVWNRLAARAPLTTGAEPGNKLSPVIAKIPAITVAGKHTRSVRKALSRMAPAVQLKPTRRPGLQGRWKTNNRVAMQ